MQIFEMLLFKALGKDPAYRHNKGKENKQCTKLQNWLDDYIKKEGIDIWM